MAAAACWRPSSRLLSYLFRHHIERWGDMVDNTRFNSNQNTRCSRRRPQNLINPSCERIGSFVEVSSSKVMVFECDKVFFIFANKSWGRDKNVDGTMRKPISFLG